MKGQNQVVFRPFTEKDFEALAALFAQQWCSELNDEAARLASQIDICTYLAETDWSLLAQHPQTGAVLGAALLHQGGAPHERWLARKQELLAEARANKGLFGDVMRDISVIDEEAALGAEYVASGQVGCEAELKLLIVSPAAQGLGVGGRLFGGAKAQVAEAGCRGFFLLTDDSCDVSFYEHKKLLRMETRRITAGEAPCPPTESGPQGEGFNMYVYAQEVR
ncbi:GNAT family N-acetyltransferase [Paratractidigestivibacter sp.]|uniref:GNAT family N-acetyltransferase n=1 Tax=Paratractidigestivibacter sp. TaxID=2847316 RepID=UPI002AC9493F|nr:GNAT family N-acetyltransferase [Paratractidigestivibacter sp.]